MAKTYAQVVPSVIGGCRFIVFSINRKDYELFVAESILRTCKEIIFHFWLAAASAGGVSKTRTTNQ